jgi:signal transduction histidine kinase
MSRLFSGNSISAKLMGMNVLVAAIALSLACASFLLFDAFSFRENLTNSLQTEAQILASNSVSALLFNDADSATSTLSALHNAPSVLSAVIVGPSGSTFAAYNRNGLPALDPSPMPAGRSTMYWDRGSQILLGSQIQFQGKTLGTVYILAETSEIVRRIRRYCVIASLILLVCLGAALIVTASMRRVIAEPIVGLAEVAKTVTREKDYALRAPRTAEYDEVAVLVRSFNEMLGQIQERDAALLASRDRLEERVHERTAELEAANKELEAFSYSVAHDLRGPLDSIGNTTYLLQKADWTRLDPASSRQTREMIDMLPTATRRMSALIDDLLNLSRSKSAMLHVEPIDLSSMAAAIMDDLRKSDPGREVNIEITPGLRALADRGLMRVVLSNLLGNAWKYSSRNPHAQIEFKARREGNQTVFYVCDNGAGFDPLLRDRLFQPFQRLHTQEEFSGTGVGLATVARIVSRHGGKVWAESEPGQGASFFFTLPMTGSSQVM